MNRYERKGTHLLLREGGIFLRNSLGSIFSREFITILIPLLLAWELLPRTEMVSSSLVPPLSDIGDAFGDLLANRDLLMHTRHSLTRFFLGLILAIFTAVPLGIFMGWNIFIRKHILPLFQLLAPVPPPAWVPITIIFFGVGLPMQLFLIFLGAFYPILFNTYQAVKDTEPRYLASARSLGASELTLILNVYFWHSLGAIIMSIKTGVAMGLVMLVIAETNGGRTGIGFLLVESKDFFQIPHMVACMMLLGGIGWTMIEILKYTEIKLALWKVGRS
ncbi:ABC transporter permease [Chitinivibrio alkaliphilus]|uniref:ABC-type transport system, permease protein n=1 Tax=Chitinivibrio alkaliphilus ACht1 TaxID=1313304 RepID=U7D900_9BACT|nr:ABC transporter permease [Chitinivibrio alkaliphilus]ERP30870.1 ABC-type transport system, permease protein [Chitinivibrio alkaliphilus ACht1]